VLNATFAYTNPHNPLLAEVAREINGKALADITDPKTNITIKAGQQLPGLPGSKMTAQPSPETGSIAGRGPKLAP